MVTEPLSGVSLFWKVEKEGSISIGSLEVARLQVAPCRPGFVSLGQGVAENEVMPVHILDQDQSLTSRSKSIAFLGPVHDLQSGGS